ncbi:MAG: AMP-binding protein [candidate division KSB1 bacterium]|nr:AMP-binding protein [candidate division KSB1 bacterium]
MSLPKLTLKHVLENSVETYPNHPALSFVDGDPITYKELGKQVTTLSEILRNQGVFAQDRIAILSENMPNWGVAYFAVTTMGAVAVPILPDFHANEVHHILRHSEAKVIFISEKQLLKLEDAKIESLKTVFIIDDFSIIHPESRSDKLRKFIQDGRREYNKLRESALKRIQKGQTIVEEDQTASIIYTSGTTGHSKGVVLTHKNIVFDAISTLKFQPVTENDRLLSILPLSHSYENTIGFIIPMVGGAHIYYLDKPPVPRVLIPAMQKVKPTMMLTVPLIMEKIYKARVHPQLTKNALMRKMYNNPVLRKKLHKLAAKKIMKTFGGELKFYGIGGALLSSDVELFLREGGFPYAIGYGLTETSPLIAGTSVAETKFRSTGPAIPGVKIKIHEPDPKTGEGEIWVQGDNVMQGYFRDPERTKEVFVNSWFRTGDLGILDKDGYLYIKGRLKNVIVGSNGENIYPEEIETILNKADYVMESLVYEKEGNLCARVHLDYEELDKELAVNKQSDTRLSEQIQEKLTELKKKVNANVSPFSRISKIIEQQEPFEKTPTKKIKRYLYVE